MKFHGIYTALVTPFRTAKSGESEVDFESLEALLKTQIAGKVSGVVVLGTTAETATLSSSEKKEIVKFVISRLKKTTLKVIVGTGTNSTHESIENSKWAEKEGADALLVVTPYYNKPTQVGMIAHFNAVADAVKIPIILYNVPSRTGVSLTSETIAACAKNPRIQALKEATGNITFASEIASLLSLKKRELTLLSGDDLTFLPFLSVGGVGTISVASNLVPKEMNALQSAFEKGNVKKARAIHEKLFPLFVSLFVESNPIPAKQLLAKKKIIRSGEVRLPLLSHMTLKE